MKSAPTLKRALTLPLLTLYGLGVTIGAGIYVLVGATAARAGLYAPVSFLLAAGAVAFTAFSYSELATRHPVSAGEAAYVRVGLNSKTLSLIVGLLVALSGIVSSAAISIGAAAYLQHFIDLPAGFLTAVLILLLGVTAAWGIVESILIAGVMTLIEIGGLGLVIYQGVTAHPDIVAELHTLLPPLETEVWAGVFSAVLLAFFAFVGFEDMANVAEEVKSPSKTLPRAIILTLAIATLLYVAVVSVAVLTIPAAELSTSAAPLALLFDTESGATSTIFITIAVIATTNGVLVQMIMSSRVLYGLGVQESLPALFARISPVTRTPVTATALVVGLIMVLALFFPIAGLAEMTSRIVLAVFVIVNLALWRLKRVGGPPKPGVFVVASWVPIVGALACLLLLMSSIIA
ncbi:MAG: amino acid permease [Hyphomicrobiales bacterium]|nr:amino acid permease [Hyphomicrobiales bacterium]